MRRPALSAEQTKHCNRLMRGAYRRLLAGTYAQLRRAHAAFHDIDLSHEDLTQFAALKGTLRFHEIVLKEPKRYAGMDDAALINEIVARGLWAVRHHIIDIKRKRYRRRQADASAPPPPEGDDRDRQRLAAVRRMRKLADRLKDRERRVLDAALARGTLETRELCDATGLPAGAIYGALRAIRAVAERQIDHDF